MCARDERRPRRGRTARGAVPRAWATRRRSTAPRSARAPISPSRCSPRSAPAGRRRADAEELYRRSLAELPATTSRPLLPLVTLMWRAAPSRRGLQAASRPTGRAPLLLLATASTRAATRPRREQRFRDVLAAQPGERRRADRPRRDAARAARATPRPQRRPGVEPEDSAGAGRRPAAAALFALRRGRRRRGRSRGALAAAAGAGRPRARPRALPRLARRSIRARPHRRRCPARPSQVGASPRSRRSSASTTSTRSRRLLPVVPAARDLPAGAARARSRACTCAAASSTRPPRSGSRSPRPRPTPGAISASRRSRSPAGSTDDALEFAQEAVAARSGSVDAARLVTALERRLEEARAA